MKILPSMEMNVQTIWSVKTRGRVKIDCETMTRLGKKKKVVVTKKEVLMKMVVLMTEMIVRMMVLIVLRMEMVETLMGLSKTPKKVQMKAVAQVWGKSIQLSCMLDSVLILMMVVLRIASMMVVLMNELRTELMMVELRKVGLKTGLKRIVRKEKDVTLMGLGEKMTQQMVLLTVLEDMNTHPSCKVHMGTTRKVWVSFGILMELEWSRCDLGTLGNQDNRDNHERIVMMNLKTVHKEDMTPRKDMSDIHKNTANWVVGLTLVVWKTFGMTKLKVVEMKRWKDVRWRNVKSLRLMARMMKCVKKRLALVRKDEEAGMLTETKMDGRRTDVQTRNRLFRSIRSRWGKHKGWSRRRPRLGRPYRGRMGGIPGSSHCTRSTGHCGRRR